MSKDSKSIVELNDKKYVMVRTIGNTEQNEYGWYDYDYVYTFYDEAGAKQGEIIGVSYIQHLYGSKFYAYNNKTREYFIIDPLTGEKEATDFLEILYCNDGAVAVVHMDENYNFKGISDPDGSNYREMDMYDTVYPISTNDNTFLVAQLKLTEAREAITGEDRYTARVQHLLDLNGEKVVDMEFDQIYAHEDNILAHEGENVTFVLDGKTGEVLRGLPGNVVSVFEDTGVFIKVEENEDSQHGRIYSLMDFDINVLSTGWEGYSDMYRGGTDEYFMFYKYSDPESYSTDMYIVNTEGDITFGPFGEKDAWIIAMCKNSFITERYDSEEGKQVYEAYDYNGNRIDLGKEYVSIQRQYNNDGYNDYFILAYENPVSAGHIFDIFDMELNVVYSGFNYVYPYGDSGRFISAAQGFNIGIFDLDTGKWIYKERNFNDLED